MESISVPTLHTNRLMLILAPIGAAHSLGVFNLWSHPDVCRYSGPVVDYDGNVLDTPCTTIDQSDRIIEFWEQAARDGWASDGPFASGVRFRDVHGNGWFQRHLSRP